MIKESRRREKEKNKANRKSLPSQLAEGVDAFMKHAEACNTPRYRPYLRAEANCFDAHWLRGDDTPT